MPYIDHNVILQAKKIDLLTYLQTHEPQELVRFSGNVYCTRTHDSLKISNGKWFWFSRNIGGKSALDYLIKVRNMRFTDAVEQIMGRAAVVPLVFSPREVATTTAFCLPPRAPTSDGVIRYLRGRGIDGKIIRFCIDTGRLYETHNHVRLAGRTYTNAVFIGFDTHGVARYAALRGIGTDFKGEAAGSDKRFAFSIPANFDSSIVHLFESAIDLLSYATLQKLAGQDWQALNLLSLAGVYLPKKEITDSTLPAALTQYLSDNPQINGVALHLDNDSAGRFAAKAIMTVMPKEYAVADAPPQYGKDYNEYLRKCLDLPHSQKKERSYIR